jgi:alpha-glucoside transport system substrate-binding protein
MNRPKSRRSVCLVLAVTLLSQVGLAACVRPNPHESVSVLASWTGEEEKQFKQVLAAFRQKTGIQFDYHGTRALSQVLRAEVQQGTPPDIAVVPSPAELTTYLRRGDLHPLDNVIGRQGEDTYSRQWLQLQQAGGSSLYTVAVKANLKSIIWFNPAHFPDGPPAPATWDSLLDLSRDVRAAGQAPWCMGMGSPPASGWPGTDWIEDILLRQSGLEVYLRWVEGNLPWRSPEVRRAWQTWGTIVAEPGMVRGGAISALLTNFGDAGRQMLASSPECSFDLEASFIMGSYQGYDNSANIPPLPVRDFDFFAFPEFGSAGVDPRARAWEVSADLAGLFNDTPAARQLMQFLASAEAQEIWPRIEGASAFSVNKKVDPGVYSNAVTKRIAGVLASAGTLCFDASDLMPANMRNAFHRAVLEYLSDPTKLESLLAELDQVRAGVDADEWLNFACAR